MEINGSVTSLQQSHRINVQRSPTALSFGTIEECRDLFEAAFKAADATVTEYHHLPEYDQIIDWMADNKGKGLMLAGSCGRGKTVIITGVLPILMHFKLNKIIHPNHADQIPTRVNSMVGKWAVIVDELGSEPQVNNYGEKSEGFNTIINDTERRMGLIFISTNLSSKEILDRYGERTLDRMYRLCRIIRFKGPSLRNKRD